MLTRSLIIFGQGAIRCHPYVLAEMAAAKEPDPAKASVAFDAALWGHIGFAASNVVRTLVMGLTGSHFVKVPDGVAPEMRRYYQQLTRFSAALAFLADVSMGTLGGALKRKEKLSARLGDVLSSLYLCSATLARFEREGRQAADAPLAHWAIWDAMFKAQNAFEGVISNFPRPLVSSFVQAMVFPLGRPYVVPSDQLGHEVARLLIEPSATRDRLTAPMYLGGGDNEDPVALIDRALAATIPVEAIEAKLKAAAKAGALDTALAPGEGIEELAARAVSAGVIEAREARMLVEQRALVAKVVRVDDFAPDLGTSLLDVDAPGESEPAASPAASPRRHTAAA
jgi:acyl-CoA dehydrogenase